MDHVAVKGYMVFFVAMHSRKAAIVGMKGFKKLSVACEFACYKIILCETHK